MFRLVMIVGLTAVNFTAFFVFILTLHQIIATGKEDLGGVAAILSGVLVLVPFVRGAGSLTNNVHVEGWNAIRSRTGLWLGLNAIAILCVWGLVELLPAFSVCSYNKGVEYYKSNELYRAIEKFKQAVYQDPSNSAALLSLAGIYEDIKDNDQAKKYYLLAIPSEDTPFTSLNNLARLLIKTEDYDDAIELLLRAQNNLWSTGQADDDQKNLKQGVISKNLAWAYWAADDTDLAVEAINEAGTALELAGAVTKYPEIYCLRALLLQQAQAKDSVNACELGLAEKEVSSLDISLLRVARESIREAQGE